MIKIYHNPRCSKSRQAIVLLEASGKEFEIIFYMSDNLSVIEIKNLLKLLNIKPLDLIRKNEVIWKNNYKALNLTDDELIVAMSNYPKLIERPIVVNNKKAVIGRPTELIKSIL